MLDRTLRKYELREQVNTFGPVKLFAIQDKMLNNDKYE